RRRRADRRDPRAARRHGLRALARARTGSGHHRVGATGRWRSRARRPQEHRVPVHSGSEERGVGPMKRIVVLIAALVVAGCGGSSNNGNDKGSPATTPKQDVDLTQGSGLTFAMVTHSDEGSFWSVVKKGAEQAAKDEGVKLIWSPSNNDPQKEAQ